MNLVFFLEEPSARELLRGLLPRILPKGVTPHYIVFEGKQDLEKQLPGKMRGWRMPDSRFVVLRDQDSGDCFRIKSKLCALCEGAGHSDAVVRVACRELEAWYFGDLASVGAVVEIGNLERNERKQLYRAPDDIVNPARELDRLTKGQYQKIAGSRALGPILRIEENRSPSFGVFVSSVRKLVGQD